MAQALVEIGAVLLGDMVNPLGRNLRAGALGKRIEIADHRLGQGARPQQRLGATIRGHTGRTGLEQRPERRRGAVAAAHEQDRIGTFQNGRIHGNFTVFGD